MRYGEGKPFKPAPPYPIMFNWHKQRDLEDTLKDMDTRIRSSKADITKLKTRIKDLETNAISDNDIYEDVTDTEDEELSRDPIEAQDTFGRAKVL